MERFLADIVAAGALLSRLPLPGELLDRAGHGSQSVWAYPVVGAVVGTAASVAGMVAGWLGLPPGLQAALLLAVLAILTGAMHEDGLADTADGFWGGWDRVRRLEIMKDSRIGVYGVLALILSLLIRWVAMSELLQADFSLWFVVGVAAMSRAPMAAMMAWMPAARPGGLSESIGQPEARFAWLALAAGGVIGLLTLGIAAFVAAFWIALVGLALARVAMSRIGGQTGDVLGACQQLAEIAALTSLAAFALS